MMLNDLVFLTNTDTTIGFVSQNSTKLDAIKNRPPHKKYIKAINSLKTLKQHTRVPKRFKNQIRRQNKATFILPNGNSYRVIRDKSHLQLLHRLKWAYTTSANLSGREYDEEFAIKSADVIIYPLNQSNKSSTIYKINNIQIKRIR
jgi:tRNA A37 threonylcarbamoyladenosine synthetase subunit TsaC/SUA5/YrdC